jgi:uncharacterized membrane protein YqjE
MLWSLPKAGPALLRHLAAYVDLASLDLARSRREIAAEVLASAIVALCALFVLFLGCLVVVAYTWDTPYRVSAIIWMGAGFMAAGLLGLVYRSNTVRAKSEFLASVRQAWREDQVLLERILSDED